MHTWLSFTTGGFAGPVCLAVTVVGLVLSVVAWRRRGVRSFLRGAAWSLLPLAAWLTHSLGLLGRLVSAIVQFGSSFVLSAQTWLGVILVAVAALLFLVSGGIPLIRRRRRRKKDRGGNDHAGNDRGGDEHGGPPQVTRRQPAGIAARRGAPQGPAGEGLDPEVQEILRRHGIS